MLYKVSSQVEYGQKLIEDAEGKLAELEAERGKVMASLDVVKFVMKPKEGGPDLIDIYPMSKELEGLQSKIDAQKSILQVFSFTCGDSKAGEAKKAKLTLVDDAWANAKSRQELWRRHRGALQSQLRGTKVAYKRPATKPALVPSLYQDYESDEVDIQVIEVGFCPFCLRGFEPVWDCRFVFYRHAYHNWCALIHFSKSTTCIVKGCDSEMHEDWWICASVAKPQLGKDGVIVAAAWDRVPFTSTSIFSLLLMSSVLFSKVVY